MLALVALTSIVGSFQQSPPTWWKIDVAEMKREGVLVDYPSHMPKDPDVKLDRYVHAVCVNAAWTNLKGLFQDAEKMTPAETRRARLLLARFIDRFPPLVSELHLELTQLGVDTEELRAEMRTLKAVSGRFAIPSSEGDLWSSEAKKDQMRQDLGFLLRDGLLTDALHLHGRPETRIECAKLTFAGYQSLFRFLQPTALQRTIAHAKVRNKATDGAVHELESLTTLAPAIERLDRLVIEFTPELLSANPAAMRRHLTWAKSEVRRIRMPEIGEAHRRFPDVPQGHWADTAVHNLRREGILWGYPNGKFGN